MEGRHTILQLPTIPRTMLVGGSIIGCEYGAIFATLGTEVALVDRRDVLLDSVGREIVGTLTYHMRKQNMTRRLREAMARVFIDAHNRMSPNSKVANVSSPTPCSLLLVGQAVMTYGGTIDYCVNSVFNYPTLAEAYKIAAFDGANKL